MPRLTPTRTEVSDRFPVLGFRVHTGKEPYFEVAIATDPSLFHADAKGRRMAQNFYSTHSSGPLTSEHGEALYLVPSDVLRRFAGSDRLYYSLATFEDSSRANPEVLDTPDNARPWVTLSKSFTGSARRRLIGAPPQRAVMNGNGYGSSDGRDLTWAGDTVTPGTIQAVAPKNGSAASSGSASKAQPSGGQSPSATSPIPASTATAAGGKTSPAAAATAVAEEEFEYDDGHGEWQDYQGTSAADEADVDSKGIDGPVPDSYESATDSSQGYVAAMDAPTPEYPQASRFVPAAEGNYYPRSSAREIKQIVIHITDGHENIDGTISWFQDPKAKVSAHYIVGQHGEVVQMVRHQDIAYHASSANSHSIGIEHVARSPHEWDKILKHPDPGLKPTEAEYCASAALVRWLCAQFNLPLDRVHILGHNEADPKKPHPDCPTGNWDWDHYMSLVTNPDACATQQPATSQSLAVRAAMRKVKARGAGSVKSITFEQVDPGYTPSNTADALQYQKQFQDRKQAWQSGVPDTTFFPHSAICRFRIMQPDGEYIGTGFYIGQDRILTCAHNVAEATSVTIIPGKNDAAEPFGSFTVKPSDWVIHPKYDKATADGSDTGHDFDLAVIKVSTPPPNGQAFTNLEELLECQSSPIIVCGYAAKTVDPDKQHLDGDAIRLLSDSGETLQYNLQTEGGNSGSPVYYVTSYDDDVRQQCVMEVRVVGVHISSFSRTLNQGCRLTADKIAWIQSVGQPMSAGAQAAALSQTKYPKNVVYRSQAMATTSASSKPMTAVGKPPASPVKKTAVAAATPKTAVAQPKTTTAVGRSKSAGFALADTAAVTAPALQPETAEQPLSLKDADYTEEIGDDPDPERTTAGTPVRMLNNAEMYRIAREVARADSGDTPYTAISTDREYSTPGHGAYQKRHFGLCYGLLLFSQESGHLGSVLQLMQQRDPDKFSEIFGAESNSLLSVTNGDTPEARLAPVNGQPLWSGDWPAKFQAAGAHPPFQAAQNEEAIEGLFRPILNVSAGLGLVTDRLLAMALDCASRRGLGGAIRWLVSAAGPFETEDQRQHALETLGVGDLSDFQAEVGWTPQDGQFGPETHAALAGAIRRLGLIPLPRISDLPCRLVAMAEGGAKERLIRLRDSDAFTDVVYRVA